MNSETPDYTDNGLQDKPRPASFFHGCAGFWKRYAATFIDGGLLFVLAFCVLSSFSYTHQWDDDWFVWWIFRWVVIVAASWLYFALCESSSSQATPGKMAVGIKVTDMNGNRISFVRASERHFIKILSFLTCLAGYIMAAFTQKKQGLHDIIAGCLVVNTHAPTRAEIVVSATLSTIGTTVCVVVLHALYCTIENEVLKANATAMSMRAKEIYVTFTEANREREPLGLGTVWPRTGKPMEEGGDIGKMTFANSTDYFKAVYDDKNRGTADWAPYVAGFDYSKCAAVHSGVPLDAQGGLTAKNNAWTIAANVTDDMSDFIPVIISRNVDPASLIPGEGDLSQQFIRPSEKFKTPFGGKWIIILRKGGTVHGYPCHSMRKANLKWVYHGASEADIPKIRDALQKIEYLEP